jgi:DNA (cytosine-5)-methyltransferase 1
MNKPRLLDLFCGAGGAGMGYSRAGFDVVGVDINPQPHYPFEFHQADALTFPLDGFDAIHASPPCQAYAAGPRSTNETLGRAYEHPRLIERMRERLRQSGVPYVIENVVGAPMLSPVRLCGTSFDRPLRRHRLFESPVFLFGLECRHDRFTERRYWTGWTQGGHGVGNKRRATTVQVYGNGAETHEWGPAMGIDWMTTDELREAIPPAYTEYIGHQLMAALRAQAA